MVRELKSFLGRVSYIIRFVPGLVSVTSELSKLLKKGAEFTWGAEQQGSLSKDPTDHEPSTYPTSASTWAAFVAVFSIKFSGYLGTTSPKG